MLGARRDVCGVTGCAPGDGMFCGVAGCSVLDRIFAAWLDTRRSTGYLRRDWMRGARRDVDGVAGCSVLDRRFAA
jgi:hypothetical protein